LTPADPDVCTIHRTAQLPAPSPYFAGSITTFDLSFAVHCSAVSAHVPSMTFGKVRRRITSACALYEQARQHDQACSSHVLKLLRCVPAPAQRQAFGAARRKDETARVRRQRRQASGKQRKESRSAA